MAIYEYKYARGHDQTALTNTEDAWNRYPRATVIPLGSVRRKTLDHNVQTNGNIPIEWFFGPMSKADFQTMIIALFDDWETENADLTIDTRGPDEVFHRGNCTVHRPIEGVDYTRQIGGNVDDLKLTLDGFEEVTDSAFSTDFSFDFAS
jgi:hypothetical protein